jgi:hypothetical protein
MGGEHVVHAGDAVTPDLFESVQGVVGRTERRGVGLYQVLPAPALLGHESGALQDGHMLLHGGEAHRVLAGQGRDRVPLAQCAPDDVPSRAVGEGVEQLIGVGAIYNHSVVYNPGPPLAQGPTGDRSPTR